MNHAEILDGLIREIDALQSHPFRHIARIAREWVIRATITLWWEKSNATPKT